MNHTISERIEGLFLTSVREKKKTRVTSIPFPISDTAFQEETKSNGGTRDCCLVNQWEQT